MDAVTIRKIGQLKIITVIIVKTIFLLFYVIFYVRMIVKIRSSQLHGRGLMTEQK